jgi:hypothetical protein
MRPAKINPIAIKKRPHFAPDDPKLGLVSARPTGHYIQFHE